MNFDIEQLPQQEQKNTNIFINSKMTRSRRKLINEAHI